MSETRISSDQDNASGTMSLKVKVALFTLLIGMIPLAVLGTYSFLASARSLDAGMADRVDNRADLIKGQIEAYFRTSGNAVLSIASSDAWAEPGETPEASGKARREQVDDFSYFNHMFKSGILDLWFVDANGKPQSRIVSGAHGKLEGFSASPYLSNAESLGLNEALKTEPYRSSGTDLWVAGAIAPVAGPNGQRLGYLVGERPVSQLRNILQQQTHFGGEIAFIIGKDNDVLASSSTEVDNAASKLSLDLPETITDQFANDDGSSGSVAARQFSNDGEPFFYSARVLDFGKNNDNEWRVALAVPKGSMSAATSSTAVFPILIILVFGVVAVVSALMGGTIVRPISHLSAAAERVANGDLHTTVELDEHDELGLLAGAFNKMTANLKTMVENETNIKEDLQRTVAAYSGFIDQVAGGDLAERLTVEVVDEGLGTLGRNLNSMVASLHGMASEITDASIGVGSASQEILAAVAQHNAGATEQASAVDQTIVTVDEVRKTADQTAELAQAVAEQAQKSVEISDSGLDAVERTIVGMERIDEKVNQISGNIITLSEQTQQIGNIIASVNDISEQSNLLALNASIEAARAGELGKGFAVVAAEVRNLAEQSQQATSQVRAILDDIQTATNGVVGAAEDGTADVQDGMKLASQAGVTIRTLAKAITNAAESAEKITASVQQQSLGMDQIADAMQDIGEGTEQTLESTRRTERATDQLAELGERLKTNVEAYKLREDHEQDFEREREKVAAANKA